MIIQGINYIVFYQNKDQVTRYGLSLLQQKVKERKMEGRLTNSACRALKSEDKDAEVIVETDPARYLISHKSSKYQVPDVFNANSVAQKRKSNRKKEERTRKY